MAHVIVKLWPGKSDTQRQRLADRIANDVMDVLGYGEESVSVGFEEISSGEWAEKVNKTDIENPRGKLYKKPLRGWLRAARCQTELATCARGKPACSKPARTWDNVHGGFKRLKLRTHSILTH